MKIFRPADFGVGIRLSALATYLPDRVVTNAELVGLGAPLSEAEIEKLTGIRSRRWAAADQATSDLAVLACRRALELAAAHPSTIDRLVLGTSSPDYPSPATACLLQHPLGLGQVPAFDVSAACAGFVFALDIAARALATGDNAALAVAADMRSRYLNVADRSTSALFGDGAVAAVLTRGAVGDGIVAIGTLTDGSGAHSVYVPAGGTREPASERTVREKRHTLRMADGPKVYFQAVDGMLETANQLLRALDLSMEDIALVVPHQPNARLLDRLAQVGRIPATKLFINVQDVGNTSSAACGIALEQALVQKRIGAGDRVLLLTAGAGYTAAAALLRFGEALPAVSSTE